MKIEHIGLWTKDLEGMRNSMKIILMPKRQNYITILKQAFIRIF